MPDPLPRSRTVSLARFQIGKIKIIADAGERLDRLSGDAVEIGRCITEALGHGAAHLEVELAVRLFGDAAIHRLDLGFEFHLDQN